MSRIGKHPVPVPAGVTVNVKGQTVTAKGKLGELTLDVVDDLAVSLEEGSVKVEKRHEGIKAKTMWGTTRTLIANLVKGVNEGFTVNLEINGVGFRAAVQGKDLVLQLGFSHDVVYPIPAGITMKCEKPTALSIFGADKRQVGQVAAEIRAMKKPEPYKGKGIKYDTEVLLRKEGKKK